MIFVKLWVHLVFNTKNKKAFMNQNIRKQVFKNMTESCKNNGLALHAINGYSDYVHCLVSLNNSQSIAQVAQLIKDNSSTFINQQMLSTEQFIWEDDYYATSVSESKVASVINFIRNQEHTQLEENLEVREQEKELITRNEWHMLQSKLSVEIPLRQVA